LPQADFQYLLNEPLRSGENRLKCLVCSPQRKAHNRHERTLNVRDLGDRITYHCWHCDEKGAIRKEGFKGFSPKPKAINSPPPPPKEIPALSISLDPLNRDCYDWLEDRRISRETADLAGLRRGTVRGADAIGFPYQNEKGEITGYKLRSIETKAFSWVGNAGTFFLGHMIDPAEPSMIITEGEMDALSCLQAGLKNVVSLPHGSTGGSNPDDSKLACLSRASAQLKPMKKIVIATDNDGPGRAVGSEIKRRVGLWRAYAVHWPEDCKDANDVLMDGGEARLRTIIAGATPESIPGLTKPSAFREDMMRFRRGDVLQGFSTGLMCLDPLFRITPGVFTTITGHPGHGKSDLVDQIHINMAMREGWNFGIWSRENAGFVHVAKLIEKFQKKRFHPDVNNVMSEREIEEGFELVEKHATFITSDGGPDTMETILERMTGAVMRDGIKSCVIDPYNYIQKNAEVAREDLQISEMLTLGTDWAKNHECHVFFVAHPKTMDEDKVPTGASISGGGTFNAKTDFGLTVHRPDKEVNVSTFHNWKTRHSWLGRIGRAELGYNIDRSTFYDLDAPDEDAWATGSKNMRGAEVVEFEVVNGGRSRYRDDDFSDDRDL
jgi:twinkle protein